MPSEHAVLSFGFDAIVYNNEAHALLVDWVNLIMFLLHTGWQVGVISNAGILDWLLSCFVLC
jgi:hypothetical protein